MLGCGGAVNDGHEKNSAPGTTTVFQTLQRIMYPNRLPFNSARERALSDAAKKDLATDGTARKELTLLERTFRLQSSPALERNNTDGKNSEPQASHAADARLSPTHSAEPKPDERSNVKLRGAPTRRPEQRPYADDTREPINASPRRVPLECNVRRHLFHLRSIRPD